MSHSPPAGPRHRAAAFAAFWLVGLVLAGAPAEEPGAPPGDSPAARFAWAPAAETVAVGPAGAPLSGLSIAFTNTRVGGRDDRGRLHLVWSDGRTPYHGVRGTDGRWTAAALGTTTGRANKPTLALLPDGVLVAAWGASEGRGAAVAWSAVSRDYGVSWSAPARVAPGPAGNLALQACRGGDGKPGAVAAWHAPDGRVSAAVWDGSGWSAPVPLNPGGGAGADVALGGAGASTLACWEEAVQPGSPLKRLWLADSPDGGRSWSAPAALPTAGAGFPEMMQDACLDGAPDGRVYLGFQGAQRVYLACAEPAVAGGLRFRLLVDAGPGLFAHVEAGAGGVAACAWEHFTGRNMKNDAAKTVGLALTVDGGRTFTGPHAIPGAAEAPGAMQGAVLVSPEYLDVVWIQRAAQEVRLMTRSARIR
ncbi:MAG: exo-alpha-sialidase [Planctomycetes bacterium]|nr:exo-alpha-sialidase [Planctomycetota bacterium]